MDLESYRELIKLVQETPKEVGVILSFVPNVTDGESNEAYPLMVVSNLTDASLVQAMTSVLSEE